MAQICQRKIKRKILDVNIRDRIQNTMELRRRSGLEQRSSALVKWVLGKQYTSPCIIAELTLQTFLHFPYVTAHSPTLPSLYLRHNSFSNSSVASPTSQFILQPFFRFSYVTVSSLTSPGEPPMVGSRDSRSYDCGEYTI